MELSGKIKVIMDLQTFDSGFTKREFVVTTTEQYPQDVKFECIKDRTSLLENVAAGDDVTVAFNIRGNEYNGKYFVNLQAWKMEKGIAAPQAAPIGENVAPMVDAGSNDVDDLPF